MKRLIFLGLLISWGMGLMAQSAGQWGACEFATTTTLNAYDPSSDDWGCKLAYCQANDTHYYWNGSAWAAITTYNIYTQDGSLTGNRTLSLNGYDLTVDVADNGSTQLKIDNNILTFGRDALNTTDASVTSTGDMLFSVDNGNTFPSSQFSWGTAGSPDLGISDPNYSQWMQLSSSGLRLSDYGSGSITGTMTRILGVDTDGDVIEVTASSLDTDTYLGANDQTLTGNRSVSLGSNELTFDATTDVVIESTGEVGIGTNNPNSPLHIYESTGTTASGTDGSLILEHGNSGGTSSIVFKSTANAGSDYGYISFSDDGSGNGSTSENALLSIGVENDGATSFQDDIALMPTGSVGIGTTSPAARLDVDGGTVKFSDYGTGANTGTETYTLAVDADGDVVEMNTVKSSQAFYPPAVAIDASSTGTGLTLDLHQEYVDRFGSPDVVSSGAPSAIPYYGETELYYYVTDYDTAVFANMSISTAGVLTYDIIASPVDDYSLINVVFVVK